MGFMRDSRWAKEIIDAQQDGPWGPFHALSEPRKGQEITTEQALRRLHILGYTAEDPVIARTLDLLRLALRGEFDLPDRREVTHDWDLFSKLMTATWLRVFLPDDPDACAFAARWGRVVSGAFAGGAYDAERYKRSYAEEFGMPARGARFVDFVSFYTVALLVDMLPEEQERLMLEHILHSPWGIYYIYDLPLNVLPERFEGKKASRYLEGIALLARYRKPFAAQHLQFVADWIRKNRDASGQWDLGPGAKDGIYYPLSDDWRKIEMRKRDYSTRIGALLAILEEKGP